MYDGILFGLTAATSLTVSYMIGFGPARSGWPQRALWSASFAILFVVAAGVSLYGLSFLSQPLVGPAASLIPGFMAAGVLWTWKRPAGSYYTRYVVGAFVVLLAASLIAGAPGVLFVVFIHLPSGLVIFLLPLFLVLTKKKALSGALVGIGGLLIGVAGMGLATLSAGVPILPADLVLDLLAPVFFAMTVSFGVGLIATPGWGRKA